MLYQTNMPLLSGLIIFSLTYINRLALKSASRGIADEICER